MERIVNWMNRPASVFAAGAIGLFAAAGVLANLMLASCESRPWTPLPKSGETAANTQPRTPSGAGNTTPGTFGADSSSPPGTTPTTSGIGNAPPSAFVPPQPAPASIIVGQIPGSEPLMRVRLATAVASIALSSVSGISFASEHGSSSATLAPAGPSEPLIRGSITVSVSGANWSIGGGSPSMPQFAAALPLVLTPLGPGGAIMVNGQSHPGRLRLSLRRDASGSAGSFDAVEFVALEDYLPGVVAKEMLSNWPGEAYRVQAVCARTYALHERSRALVAGEAFDVESSDQDQVYAGITTNLPAIEAVRATRGQVITFDGRVLRAYFSSTCGGRTASARDTWPSGPGFEFNLAPPLQARQRDFACQDSPLYRWSVTRDTRELSDRIRTFGSRSQLMVRQLGEVRAIEALGFNDDARPSQFRVVEPGGKWYQLSGEQLRLACNTSGLGIASAENLASSASVMASSAGTPAPGTRTVTLPAITRATRVNSSDFEASVRGRNVTITGRGFGHGVGMCQYCAKGFASRGESWQRMIPRFYPGAQVQKVY